MLGLRLIIDPPASGGWNMAIDEALLDSAATDGTATLRLYQWREATLSLGYFQAAADRQLHEASRECPLIRRASGGGAILHDHELTYSLALPEKSTSAAASQRLYEHVHLTLIDVLSNLGIAAQLHGRSAECENDQPAHQPAPFLCFQRRTCFDVIASDAKLVGSAQRRRRGAILQHGSILLSRSEFAPELPGSAQVAGKPLSADELSQLWPPRLVGRLGCSLVPGCLTGAEKDRANVLNRERFTADNWLNRR